MEKFRIFYTVTKELYFDVDAENLKEAIEIAENKAVHEDVDGVLEFDEYTHEFNEVMSFDKETQIFDWKE